MSMKVGFIGLGMMGEPMAGRLLTVGFSLNVYNRTKQKADTLLSRGAHWEGNPKRVSGSSDVVITMVSNSEALQYVSMRQDGILAGLPVGGIHVDMSTVAPSATKALASEYESKGRFFLHAPVLGSIPQVQEGSLLIFAGGDHSAFMRCKSILEALGKRIWHFEQVAQAAHMKLVCNFFIASMITTLSEGLLLGRKAEITPETILEVLRNSALNAPMYQSKGEAMRQRSFAPRFLLDHMLKDVNLIREASERLSLQLPTLEILGNLFSAAKSRGLGREDYSAVVKVLEQDAKARIDSG